MKNQIRISHIEYSLPIGVVTNEELQALHPDWKMDLITAKTGVESRHFSGKNELALDLGYQAAVNVLEKTGTPATEIDALIFCTQSPDHIMPPNATLLHARLGLSRYVMAFDYTLACSGFIYGLAMAKAFIDSLGYRKVLLVTGDTYSRYIHPEDRSAITLFGDGAAASLIEPNTDQESQSALIDIILATDGAGGDKFAIKAGGLRFPRSEMTCLPKRDIAGNVRTDETLYMNGRAVLDFVSKDVPESVEKILDRNQLKLSDLDLILFHQASLHALETLHKLLNVSPSHTFSNIRNLGNTVSASLPILLKDAESAGKLRRNDLVLLVGFGVGFSWGCCLLRW